MAVRPNTEGLLYGLASATPSGSEMLSHISYGLVTRPRVWVCSPAGPGTQNKALLQQGTRLKLQDYSIGTASAQLAGVYAA